MSDIKERILQIPVSQNIKKEDFFNIIKASYSNFRGKSKKSAPSADILVEISTNFPKINIDWLLTGKGEMMRDSITETIKHLEKAADKRRLQMEEEGVISEANNAGKRHVLKKN